MLGVGPPGWLLFALSCLFYSSLFVMVVLVAVPDGTLDHMHQYYIKDIKLKKMEMMEMEMIMLID